MNISLRDSIDVERELLESSTEQVGEVSFFFLELLYINDGSSISKHGLFL